MNNAQSNKSRSANPSGNRPQRKRSGNARKGKSQSTQAPRNFNRDNGSSRTPGSIIGALSKAMSQKAVLTSYANNDYVRARLYCCIPRNIPSIPDGSSGRHIAVCMYALDRVSFLAGTTGAQSFGLNLNPWFPTPVAISSNTANLSVNGSTLTGNSTPIGLGMPAQFANLPISQQIPGSTSNAIDIYSATSMRIVSQTHSIRYTGPVTTCSGMIRTWPCNWSLSTNGVTTTTSAVATAPVSGISVMLRTNSAGYSSYVPIGTTIATLDLSSSDAPTVGTFSARPEQGLQIRLPHISGKYEPVPVSNVPIAVVTYGNLSSTAANGSHYFGQYTSPSLWSSPGTVLAWDNDWVGQHVVFDNVNPDASFSIETCVCVELTPLSVSVFANLTKGPPQSNLSALRHVQSVINSEGPATFLGSPK